MLAVGCLHGSDLSRRRRTPRRGVLKCILTPMSAHESWTGCMMSGSATSASAHGRGSTRCVSMTAVREGRHHLESQRRRFDDDRDLRVLEDLVPLDRPPDVLHVVQTPEIAPGHTGVRVVEAGRHDQGVEPHRACPHDLDLVGGGIEAVTLVSYRMSMPTSSYVSLVARKSRSNVGISLPVHVRDATRAVADVFELREDGDLCLGIRLLGRACGADTSCTTTDDDDPPRHAHPSPVARRERRSL